MTTRAAVVIESHEIVRSGLQKLIANMDGVDDVVSFRTWAAAESLLYASPPRLLIISSRVGAAPQEGLLESVTSHGTRILVLVPGVEPTQVLAAARIPAHGFLNEHDLTSESVCAAMEQIDRGGSPMPAAMARQLVDLASSGRPRRSPDLTLRERTVLEHMAAGLSNKCIARELAISPHGVKRHVANILAKLNSSNRTVAVMTAIQEGLLPPPPSPYGDRIILGV